MIEKLQHVQRLIGNTPLVELSHSSVNVFAKLEFHNLMGSVKMRPAFYILKSAIERGDITDKTTIIESSSGNFAVALATLCKQLGIKFIPVIDPNVNESYENLLNAISYRVVKVTERDETGGFLLSRIKMVKQLCAEIPHSFWTNQYENYDNYLAHYHGIGTEIADHFEELDYAFIGVSSGGTIAGVSNRLKEKFPEIKIVAVDTAGSVIFGDQPKKRYIPGIGSSMVPPIIHEAQIDEVVLVPEANTVEGCYNLFEQHAIFAGGSSGTCFYAINQYFQNKSLDKRPNVVFLCPDSGMSYVNTVYNKEWVAAHFPQHREIVNA